MENQFAVFPREVKEHKTPINLINDMFSEAGMGITFFLSMWVDELNSTNKSSGYFVLHANNIQL